MCATLSQTENICFCNPEKCMNWVVALPYVEREDHSGGENIIRSQSLNDNHYRPLKRTGAYGCLGHVYLEEVGYCGLNHYEEGE